MPEIRETQGSGRNIAVPDPQIESQVEHDGAKAAVVVFSELGPDHGESARVVNALQIVREFKEAGDDVKLIFDGGGVTSIAAMVRPDHNLHNLYKMIEDKVSGACAFCSKAFGVKEQLEAAGVSLLTDFKQHPSIRSLVVDGYQVMII